MATKASDGQWDPDDVPPEAMLGVLKEALDLAGLFRRIEPGWLLMRARLGSDFPLVATELGPPPGACVVRPNRWSNGTQGWFYAASDEDTAVAEIRQRSGSSPYAVGTWRTLRPLSLLDLCELPAKPSWFDVKHAEQFAALLFLEEFAEAVSRPVYEDESEGVASAYAATQRVARFIHDMGVERPGASCDGVIYRSACRATGGASVVLFCDQAACVDHCVPEMAKAGKWIELLEACRVG